MSATPTLQEEASAAAQPFLEADADWQSRECDDWQTTVAQVHATEQLPWSRMLEINGELPPPLKFALDPGLSPELRAEKLRDTSAQSLLESHLPETSSMPPEKDALAAFCREAGWEPTIRGPEEAVMISLERSFSAGPARLTASVQGWRVAVEIGNAAEETPTVRAAREALLLRLNHHIRLVRALRRPTEAGLITELEAGFCTSPSAEQIGHALGALSLAARCCADLFEGLGDEDLAGAYLATMKPAAIAAEA